MGVRHSHLPAGHCPGQRPLRRPGGGEYPSGDQPGRGDLDRLRHPHRRQRLRLEAVPALRPGALCAAHRPGRQCHPERGLPFYTGTWVQATVLSRDPAAQALVDEQQVVPAYTTYENSTYFDEIYHVRTAYEHILA